MRRAVIIVILVGLLLSAWSLSASAQSQNAFYLHASYLLDQNGPTGTTTNALKLALGEYYVWKTTPFSVQQSYPLGVWTVSVWMNTTQQPTQYRLKLGTVNASGEFVEHAHAFTPIITAPSPTQYGVSISAGVFSVPAGESLGIGFLRHWQNESYSPTGYIFFDSQAMCSGLSGPSVTTTTSATTQTTTQQTTTTTQYTTTATTGVGAGAGFALAIVGIAAGMAVAGGGAAAAMSARSYSEVFAYGGYYYCRKHRVPLYSVSGWLWCPRDRRYLSRTCRSCGNAVRQSDRFCDRCGRAI